ncbi:MAG: hypothetical protein R8J85_02745 [Mariprofundales bacterium]
MAKILGVNWVEGELHCVYMDGKKVLGTWVSSTAVNELAEFNLAIRDVCNALEVKQGSQLAMSYESHLLSHPFIHIPMMKAADLEKVLYRRAEQEKVFEGAASWSWTRTLPAKDGDGVLLHLLPRSLRNAVVRICEEFYLTPVRMVPLSEVMGLHLAELAQHDDQFHLLVALFDHQMEIMVARGDGTLLFLRDISTGWQGDASRVRQEIERTALYAKQQFGVEISKVWIAGEGTETLPDTINDAMNAEVLADPLFESATLWAQAVVSLSRQLTSNFIPWYVQQRPRRRMLLRGGLAVATLLLLVTLATVVMVEMMLNEHSEDSGNTQMEMVKLQGELRALQGKAAGVQEEQRRLLLFKKLDSPQAPLLFLRQLAVSQPQGVVLHKVEVTTRGGAWPFTLQGVAGKGPNQGLELLDAFEQRLTHPPLATTLSLRGEHSWQKAVQQGDGRSFTRPLDFIIRGVIK